MPDEISVLCSADENYARQCAVTMLSVLSNTVLAHKVHFYLLSPDLTDTSKAHLKKVCDSFGARISVLSVDLRQFQTLPTLHKHFSLSTYSRLLGPTLCVTCNRLLYLDCDLIVLSDISDLYDWDLLGKPLGAVPHVSLPYQQVFTTNFPVVGKDQYFNAGVLVIDADFWRGSCATEKILDLSDTYSSKLEFADQDPLNLFFWRNYTYIPGFWNVESRLYREKLLGIPQDSETKERMGSPKLLHYTGPDKPWSSSNYVPKREIYLEYSDRLSDLIGWQADLKNRHCSFFGFIHFLWSCLRFRASLNLRKLIKSPLHLQEPKNAKNPKEQPKASTE